MSGLFGQWAQATKLLSTMGAGAADAADRATRDEALLYLKLVDRVFVKQGILQKWKPLADATIARRRSAGFGGTKALLRTGGLRRSINLRRHAPGVYTVGVHKGARGKDGKDIVDIAAVHEFGSKKKAGPSFVPQRSFLGQAHRFFMKGHKSRITKRYLNYLQGGGRLRIDV